MMKINEVYEGDCLDVMKQFPDNCIDSIITDPPYDLTGKSGNGGFMGKKWDSSGIAFDPEVWAEALRVAKPGATLMAFGGSRTYHRLTCAIEDAGWEIRDCISYFHDGTQQERAFMASLDEEQLGAYLELHRPGATLCWIYGSGFPKSHSVSAAIDKAAGAEREVVGYDESAVKRTPNGQGGSLRFGGLTSLDELKEYAKTDRPLPNGRSSLKTLERTEKPINNRIGTITAPATPLAAKFNGYGTALKPAYEPIVLAMKPIDGTFAANAERWGLAGLWIDGGRVGTDIIKSNGEGAGGLQKLAKKNGARPYHNGLPHKPTPTTHKGRWPANVILGITGDRYRLKDDVTAQQKAELKQWLIDNT